MKTSGHIQSIKLNNRLLYLVDGILSTVCVMCLHRSMFTNILLTILPTTMEYHPYCIKHNDDKRIQKFPT